MEGWTAFENLLYGDVVFGEVLFCGFHFFLNLLPQKLRHLQVKPHFPRPLLYLFHGIHKQVPPIHQVLPRHQNRPNLPMNHPDLVMLIYINSL